MTKKLTMPHPPTLSAVPAAPAAAALVAQPSPRAMVHKALDDAGAVPQSPSLALAMQHRVADVPRTERETKVSEHALDYNGVAASSLSFVEATGFPGFPTLALLGQLPEYRSMYERLADECVRAWGKAIGGENSERTKQINEQVEKLDIRAAVRKIIINEQQFGRAHAYFKLSNCATQELKALPLVPRPYTVPQGAFQGLRVVEAYWTTPNFYNSIDPTADDFYQPSSWWMLGTEVHATRLHTIVSRPVPDMLKPAYSFAGVSMTQLAMPYVDNWLRTRQSVSDTVKQFSIVTVLTDLMQALQPGANTDLAMRAALINRYRDNRNILFLDKASEEMGMFSVPLGGLDALQAQAQEQMGAVSHIPLVILLGITPTGLNASSEGEIRAWYDYVSGYQKAALHSLMQEVLVLIQLSLDGQVDPGIKWDWLPLHALTALEMAEKRNKDAQSYAALVDAQIVQPDQVAKVLNDDPDSPFAGALENEQGVIEPQPDDIEGLTRYAQEMGEQALTGAAPSGAMDHADDAPAAGIVFVAGGKVLLLKRPAGDWGFPAGRIEDGETAEGAALRETQEETGHSHESGIHDLGEFGNLHAFGAHVDRPFAIELNDEHSDHGWFGLNELPEPLHRESHTIDAIAKAWVARPKDEDD